MIRRMLLICLLVLVSRLSAQTASWEPTAGHKQIPIWPAGVPIGSSDAAPEAETTKPADPQIAGRPIVRLGHVTVPSVTVYPAKDAASDVPAVVVFPGGGYSILAIDLEGTEVCDWLNSISVTCVLLKYRVPNSGPYPKSAAALEDAQRAVGLVRQHAAEWHINPHKVGVLGFSAGGHLVAALSTHFEKRLYNALDAADQLSCRPDFAVVIYPGYLAVAEKGMTANPEIHPTAQTPPTFILQAEDDPVHVENATTYFLLLKQAKVHAELHIYAEGGHGYGLRRTKLPVTDWPRLVEVWLHSNGVLQDSSK